MSDVADRLASLDITLPRPWTLPPGVDAAFEMVVVSRGQVWLAGHGPVDGGDILMQGVVGDDLSVEQGAEAARLAGLSILASVQRTIGDLSRVSRWLRAGVYVNAVTRLPGPGLTIVGDGFSTLIRSIWGTTGGHARVSPGVRALPFNLPVVVEAVLEID